MIDSVGWDLNTVIRIISHIFRKIGERLTMLSRNRNYFKTFKLNLQT